MNLLKYALMLLLPALLWAQELQFQQEFDTIPVEINGWQTFAPWAGGSSESGPDFVDIDSDGDLDLFLGGLSGNIAYFKNIGQPQIPNFSAVTLQFDSLHSLDSRSNPDFYDMDGDQDFDAIIGSGHVALTVNMGNSSQPSFLSAPDTLFDTTGDPVFGTHVAVLDFDLDGDGDLIGGEYQGHLQFYINVGTPDSLSFSLEDDNWLGIDVGNDADPAFCDIDADGDYDMLIGSGMDMSFFRNTGTPTNPSFLLETEDYQGLSFFYADPVLYDLDSDGDFDLITGEGTFTQGVVKFWNNRGMPQQAQLQYWFTVTQPGAWGSAIDIADIDADGGR